MLDLQTTNKDKFTPYNKERKFSPSPEPQNKKST
jgi:hypothetical protein